MAELFDVIIIGSGPAGLTAAIYLTRACLKTLIIAGSKWGGQLQLTTEVENFPGFPDGIQGPALMHAMRKQAEKFGAVFLDDDIPPTDVTRGTPFTITVGGKAVAGKTILIATGADAKTLGIPGEKELTGHGVSYCATCDAAFFKNKHVAVVGGGDSAMEEAIFLANFSSHVTILYRGDTLRASQIMQERVKKNQKISIQYNTDITEIIGEQTVEKIKVIHAKTHETSEIPVSGVFIAIGHTPNTKVFPGIDVNERGYILEKNSTSTNVEGVFVAGDVQDARYRQAITAAGFGCMAALDIERYLAERQ
ncbi:MAG TPA: thioredoxin-disulfide reductase [Patescibacteria group bacterium]|nr:thioredoxin-disulfide reductase [Patescibacteria group bacterium]